MAALRINWESVENLAKAGAVATGEEAKEEGEEVSPFARLDRPIVVFVADPTVALSDFEKIENTVFKNEKVGLAMKAFRTIRMAPEDVEGDAILDGEGKGVPRMLVVDPIKERVKVLEEKRIKASTLYKAMKRAADKFYKERLDKTVKKHLKILNERDKLYCEEKLLNEKEGRLAEDAEKNERKLAKVRKEMEELKAEIEELTKEERELWKLTPRHKPAA